MNYNDIWSSQPFDMVSMTSSINKMEYAENFFEKELDWTVDESLTKDFGLDVEENSVRLLPVTDRAAPLTTVQRQTRLTHRLPIPRWGAEETVFTDEVIGVRETGSLNMRTLQSVSAMKQKAILANINITTAWCMTRALDGKVIDPVSKAEVFNLHQVLGTNQTVVPFDFSPAADPKYSDVNLWLGAGKRWIEDNMGAYQLDITRYTLACGRNFYRALLARPDVKAMFTDY